MFSKILSFKSKLLVAVLLFSALVSCTFAGTSRADDVPLAARLLAEPYTSTGVRVTMTNLSSMYGLATDGTYAYAISNSGNIVSTPLANLASQTPGSAVTATGTVHNVGWSVDGAPAWPNSSDLSLSYSHGCIFITNNSNTLGEIHLYCIDVSDFSVTDIAVPEDKPLPAGNYFVKSSLIDFPDGRIGKVSAETYSDADGQYESILRTYTITGTGKSASIAWSEDFAMGDPSYFAVDEHGIATDGTYLYRIQWRSYNPNTKVWALAHDATSSVVYSGQYTMPFSNMHFLAHNHTDNYYLVGHYSSNHFFITTAASPGPGPGNPLTPTFTDPTSTVGGYITQITNYDAAFTWTVTSTNGSSSTIDGSGLITVSGLAEGASATTTVTTTRTNYPSGNASVVGSAADITAPIISSVTSSPANTTTSVSWETNEIASTQVFYGATAFYTSSTIVADTSPRVTSHTVTLDNLLSCTTYHFVVTSADAAPNTTTSTDATFTTLGCVASSTPTANTSTAITVSVGGSLVVDTNDGDTITVTTPADVTATSTSLVIQVQQIAKDSVLELLGRPTSTPREIGSAVFDVKAIIDNSTVLDSFDHPVTITYHYSNNDVSGIDESTLWLYHYHNGAWAALDDCSVNASANTISCTTPSFSIFAVFGQTQVLHSGSGGAAATIYGCMDKNATNYNPYAVLPSANEPCHYITTTPTIAITQPVTAFTQPFVMVTSSGLVCTDSLYLTKPVKFGAKNNPQDVMLLQKFLNAYEKNNFIVDGFYSKDNFSAVVRWQEKYADEILKPWGAKQGTGYVYITSLKKIKQLQAAVCTSTTNKNSNNSIVFNRLLKKDSNGQDVRALQVWLNTHSFTVATTGKGSLGNETDYFGSNTQKALIKMQKKYGIKVANGQTGVETNMLLNEQ